jgi:hypothetical protein
MMQKSIVSSVIVIIGMICFRPSFAEEIPGRVSVTDKEIIERLTRLETRLEEGQKALNQRIGDVNVGLNKRIDDLQATMRWWLGVLSFMIIALFGYIVWDRRTALHPVMERTSRAEKLLDALRQYSRSEPKLAEILRSFGLL